LLITVPLAAAFVGLVAVPGISAANAVWEARLYARGFPAKQSAVAKATPVMKTAARNDAAKYVDRHVLGPLARAVQANPAAAGPLLEQVPWWMTMWELGAPVNGDANAVTAARIAQVRDPEGIAGYLAELRVRLRFAEATENKRAEQFTHVEDLIREIVRRDPARAARLRYEVARVAFAVKDAERGKAAATAALQLDADAPGPRFRLTDAERAQVRKWVGAGGDQPAR
jgi:hypothetical protein